MTISIHAAELATSVAQSLLNQGITVKPKNGHFNRLVELSVNEHLPVGESPSVESADLNAYTSESQPNGEDHTAQMEEMVQMYLRSAVARLDTVRRKVAPFIDEVITACNDAYVEKTFVQTEIRKLVINEIYTDQTYLDFIKRHEKVTPLQTQAIKTMGGFMERSEPEIMDLIHSGNSLLDDRVVSLIAEYPSNWLVDTYKELFVEGTTIPLAIDPVKQKEYIDKTIIAYFIYASMLARDLVDSTVNVKLDDYKRYMATTFEQLGGALNRFIYQLVMIVRRGDILAYYDNVEDVAYVYEHSYDQYIANGGNIEAFLAGILTNVPMYERNLLQDQETLVRWYHTYYHDKMLQIKKEFKPRLQEIFHREFPKVFLKQPLDFSTLYAPYLGEQIDVAGWTDIQVKKLTGMLSREFMNYSSDSVYELISYALVKVGLAKYGFYDIMVGIQSQMEQEGITSPRIAAYKVIMKELVAHMVSGNIEVTRN